jgi:hypothetical protein
MGANNEVNRALELEHQPARQRLEHGHSERLEKLRETARAQRHQLEQPHG